MLMKKRIVSLLLAGAMMTGPLAFLPQDSVVAQGAETNTETVSQAADEQQQEFAEAVADETQEWFSEEEEVSGDDAAAASLADAKVTPSQKSYVYDGTAKTPSVTVKLGSKVLKADTDYTVSYANNIKPGTATVTVKGKGAYTGSAKATFTILLSIEKASVGSIKASYTYKGAAIRPAPLVNLGGKILTKGTDYSVTYKNNVNAGTATVIIKGIGKHTGSITKTFKILACAISKAEVTLQQTSYSYDGTVKKPNVSVVFNNTLLEKGKDYTVSYKNNQAAGTAYAIVTGKGNFAGTKTSQFSIAALSIANAKITPTEKSFVYDGTKKKPTATVKLNGKVLTADVDYTLAYSGNIQVGTATIIAVGKGNYQGKVSSTFKINAAPISSAAISVQTTSYVYDGTAKTPNVTATIGDTVLQAGKNFTLSYSNNIEAGTATVIITGRKNYKGTVKKTFKITPAAASKIKASLHHTQYTYDGKAKKPNAGVTFGKIVLVKGVDYTIKYTNNVEVGTATATITFKGNYSGSIDLNYSIDPIIMTQAVVTVRKTSYVYDGTKKKPGVTVKLGNKKLVKDVDYIIGYTNAVNAGTANVIVAGKGHYKGKVTATFTITPAPITSAQVTPHHLSFVYDGTKKKTNVSVKLGKTVLKDGKDFTVAYKDAVNAGTATVIVVGKGNYTGKATACYTIKPIDLKAASVKLDRTSYVYNGGAKAPEATVKIGSKTLTADKCYTISYKNNVNAGTATVVVKGKGNYAGSASATFKITPAPLGKAKVSPHHTSYVFDGTRKTPNAGVVYNNKALKQDTDFTISYAHNLNAGTATLTVKGKGNFTGSASKTFTITPAPISKATVTLSKTSYRYDGAKKKPAVTVKFGKTTLVKGTSYIVGYKNNIKQGTATVVVRGVGNYKGSINKTFTIIGSFVWGKDNWSFNNSVYNFGRTSYYNQISSSFLNTLKKRVSNTEWYYMDDMLSDTWGGSCYGMTALAFLSNQGVVPYSNFQKGANSLYALDIPIYNSAVSSLITYYHVLQKTDVSRSLRSKTSNLSNKTNLTNIIKLLDSKPSVVISIAQNGWGGHAILGVGYEKGSWYYGGQYNQVRIKTCDPNNSYSNNPEYYIYFNTSTYEWTIPHYYYQDGFHSKNGAYIRLTCADTSVINNKGYIKTGDSAAADFVARLDAETASDEMSVSKIGKTSGRTYSNGNDNTNGDIVRRKDYNMGGIGDEGTDGFDLFDADSDYKFTQSQAGQMKLEMKYSDSFMKASAENGLQAEFIKDNAVSVKGRDGKFSLSLTNDFDLPTDWCTAQVSANASQASLTRADNGWIVSADRLENVTVKVSSKYDSADTKFSTTYKSALIYEIDKNTVGIAVDTDNNGTYETTINAA